MGSAFHSYSSHAMGFVTTAQGSFILSDSSQGSHCKKCVEVILILPIRVASNPLRLFDS